MTMKLDLTKPISAAMLERAGACPAQVALVRKHFGSRPLRLTRKRLRKAARLWLQVSWLVPSLTPEQRQVYDAARAEAWRVYDAATVRALLVFNAATTEAERVFYDATAEPWRVYAAATSEAWRVYVAATADALADALGML